MNKPFQTIFDRAAQIGMPESYVTDLTKHDFEILHSAEAPEAFVWILHQDGTFLFGWDIDTTRSKQLAMQVEGCKNSMVNARYFIYADGELHETDHVTCEAWLHIKTLDAAIEFAKTLKNAA